MGNGGGVNAGPIPWHGQPFSILVSRQPFGPLSFRALRKNQDRLSEKSHPQETEHLLVERESCYKRIPTPYLPMAFLNRGARDQRWSYLCGQFGGMVKL
jgi:hypothetical protein